MLTICRAFVHGCWEFPRRFLRSVLSKHGPPHPECPVQLSQHSSLARAQMHSNTAVMRQWHQWLTRSPQWHPNSQPSSWWVQALCALQLPPCKAACPRRPRVPSLFPHARPCPHFPGLKPPPFVTSDQYSTRSCPDRACLPCVRCVSSLSCPFPQRGICCGCWPFHVPSLPLVSAHLARCCCDQARIGEGCHATVYQARAVDGTLVAVKVSEVPSHALASGTLESAAVCSLCRHASNHSPLCMPLAGV